MLTNNLKANIHLNYIHFIGIFRILKKFNLIYIHRSKRLFLIQILLKNF